MTVEEMFKRKQKKWLAEGVVTGKAQSVMELLEDLGTVPDEIKEKILNERNPEILSRWHKAAAKADSIEEFLKKM